VEYDSYISGWKLKEVDWKSKGILELPEEQRLMKFLELTFMHEVEAKKWVIGFKDDKENKIYYAPEIMDIRQPEKY